MASPIAIAAALATVTIRCSHCGHRNRLARRSTRRTCARCHKPLPRKR